MVLHVPISAEAEARLHAKAAAAGLDAETFAARALEQVLTRPTLEEILGPLREEFDASGMSEEELVELLETAKHEMRAERRARTAS
jgi:hypothetical protein